ncbi:MAG: hypothetical protein ABEN55_01505, partial [Bradymonadaceae bacterium]
YELMYRTTAQNLGLSSVIATFALGLTMGCGPPEQNPTDTGNSQDTGGQVDAGDTGSPDDTSESPDTGSDTSGGGITELTALEGGNEDFGVDTALENGYWYSRYNLGSLLMRSGFGETFKPKQELVQKIKSMVDHKNFDDDKARPPMNPALMKRVGNSGDASYSNLDNFDDENPKWNFENYRWEGGADFDPSEKTNPAAFGWTMIKEAEWASVSPGWS